MSNGDIPMPSHEAAPPMAAATEACALTPDKKRGIWRWLRWAMIAVGVVAFLIAGFVAALIHFNLEQTPFVGRMVRDRIVSVLQERIDPALRLSIDTVDLRREGDETVVHVDGFRVRDIASRSLIHAPSGRVRVSTGGLLGLRFVPTGITLSGLKADVEISETGAVVISEGVADNGSATMAVPPAESLPPLERMQRAIGGVFAGLSLVRQAVGGRLPDISLDNASVKLRDLRLGKSLDLTGISARMQTANDGAASANIAFHAGNAPASVALSLSAPGETQTFKAETGEINLPALLAQFGIATDVIDAQSRGRLSLQGEVGQDLIASRATGRIEFGRMVLNLDKKMIPVPVEQARMLVDWKAGSKTLDITEVSAVSEGSRLLLTGVATPPAAVGGGWVIRLANNGSLLEPLAKGDKPVTFDFLEGQLTAYPQRKALTIDRVEARAGSASAQLSGEAWLDGDLRAGVNLDLAVRDADGRMALRLWPGFAVPEVRKWLVTNVRGGFVHKLDLKTTMPPDVLEAAIADKPLPESALALSFQASKGLVQAAPGMPLAQNLRATGTANGRSVAIDIDGGFVDAGQGRRIQIHDGSFSVADVSRKPADGRLKVKVSGPIEGALEVIKAPGIQPHVPKGVESVSAKGTIEGDVTVQLRLTPHMTPADTRVGIAAQIKNLMVDKGIGGEKLEAGAFTLLVEKDAFSLKGDGKLFGTPAVIEVKSAGKAPAVANVSLTMDEAARARKGINLAPNVTGPVGVKISARLDGENEDVGVELDLARLAIQQIAPGVSKKAGVAGRLKGTAHELDNGGWSLEKMEMDTAGVSARGSIQFGADGAFSKAQLTSLKFAPGDTMQVDIERTGTLTKVNVRGNAIDARPFLRSVLTGGIDKAGGRDIDMTVRSTVLAGFNGEVLTNSDLKMSMRGGGLQSFTLNGRLDGGPISARTTGTSSKASNLTVVTDDGGAFLRFFDLYNRMRGGRLELTTVMGSGSQQGSMSVRNFILRDEPAMKKLVANVDQQGGGDSSRNQQAIAKALRDGQEVPFTRMSVVFSRTPGRMDIKDGVLIGPEIGGNITGRLDHARDAVDLTGTFVPAFAINNMIANVPVLGPIIAGGRNEGLFAVRYSITGRASAPTLSINPLTVIAPGFLRRLIDFRGGGTGAPQPER